MCNIIEEANFILDSNLTIREAAKKLGVSKSSLNRHIIKYLINIDYDLYLKIKNVFLEHNKIRHINGGLATKYKYLLKEWYYERDDFVFCRWFFKYCL